MARYRVLERSWFPTMGVLEAGAEVEWSGPPGSNLKPLEPAPDPAKAEEEKPRARKKPAPPAS